MTLVEPTKASSCLSWRTASMMMVSANNNPASTPDKILTDLLGTAKNSSVTASRPSDMVA